MQASAGLLQVGGRRLLSDCNVVVGSVGVGGSIAILLLIGFVLGSASSWLFFWWRQRRALRIELEYRGRYGDAVKHGLPDVTAMVKLPKAASAMVEGPLAMGAWGSFKQHDSLLQTMSLKEEQHGNPSAGGMARSSSGNPFSGEVSSFSVRKNDVCSLNNTPMSSRDGPLGHHNNLDAQQHAGLIGTGVFTPAADPESPRITKLAAAAAPPSASPAGGTFGWRGMEAQVPAAAPIIEQAVESRAESFVVKGPAATGGAAGMAAGRAAAAGSVGGSDYLAALHSTATNPFETPALRQEQQEQRQGSDAKVAQKQELLQQVQGEEYGDDELDPEWASLLSDLDARLQAGGHPCLSSRERAVAIRSLIVATASQSAEAALVKAMHDIVSFRRAQPIKGATV